jgi:hypothetical protein
MKRLSVLIFILTIVCFSTFGEGSKEKLAKPQFDAFVYSGAFSKGEDIYIRYLKQIPTDDQARFELGLIQFLRGVERLCQNTYKFGPVTSSPFIPLISLPVPPNKKPESVTYDKFRKMIDVFNDDLAKVVATLDRISTDEVAVPLYMGKIRFDINGDKSYSDWETFWRIYATVNNNARLTAEEAEAFYVGLDRADAHWLSGYCHLLSGLTNFVLSFDFKKVFEAIVPYVFEKHRTKGQPNQDEAYLRDILNLRVVEPGKKKIALDNFLSCIEESRKCFTSIVSETDNAREWIPNPSQTSVIPGGHVTKQMIEYWKLFLNEASNIFLGKHLLPLFSSRENENKQEGFSMNSLILDTKTRNLYDIFSSGNLPWIEKGPITEMRFWNELFRIFRGEFIGFAIWFN